MAQNDRQRQILELVRQRGFVSIEELAGHFAVTPQTVRRDINDLCAQDLLRRYHGGAGLPSSVENLAYQARRVLQLPEKRRIAALVAQQIPDEASLFINIGTTTEEVARALLGHRRLKVITNNLNVAQILAENDSCEIIVTGGVVRNRDLGIIGEATMDFIRQFRTDFAIIGISGIDSDGALLDYDYHEVRVAREIIAHARQVFLVADHTKFGRNAVVRLGSISEVSALFTDEDPPAEIRKLLADHEIRLWVAEADSMAPALAES
jgi:DeoR family transcriptional regulator, glycerol-3-phosphate regulon repressor